MSSKTICLVCWGGLLNDNYVANDGGGGGERWDELRSPWLVLNDVAHMISQAGSSCLLPTQTEMKSMLFSTKAN
jgi:hypothetical protein